MQPFNFSAIVKAGISAGIIAGFILSFSLFIFVAPIIDEALLYESVEEEGEELPVPREVQRSFPLAAGPIAVVPVALLFGVFYNLLYDRLPSKSAVLKGVVLALAAYVMFTFIPALKYPAMPPGMAPAFDIYFRQLMRVSLQLSVAVGVGLAWLVFWLAEKRRGYKYSRAVKIPAQLAIILLFILIPLLGLPADQFTGRTPERIIQMFQFASITIQLSYWVILGAVFGGFWAKFNKRAKMQRPHKDLNNVGSE